MSRFVARRFASVIAVIAVIGFSHTAFAADPPTGAALIEAQLEEAKKLLAEDQASKAETEQKKRAIEEKLAARKLKEKQIKEELKQLCEEQDKFLQVLWTLAWKN